MSKNLKVLKKGNGKLERLKLMRGCRNREKKGQKRRKTTDTDEVSTQKREKAEAALKVR